MKIEEAIYRIKVHNEIHSRKECHAILITEALNMAVESLKKQIPKKPNGTYCPVCKRHLRCPKLNIGYTGKAKNRKGDDFCPSCGQALDWRKQE